MTQSINQPTNHLSLRLQAVADLVPACRRLLDIGTDHAWLPIALVRRGHCQTALAIDIRTGPLAVADRHIRAAGLTDQIKTLQGDGLDGIVLDAEDVVVLAGMGGYEMMDILGPEPRRCQTLILQPMKSLPELRLWLSGNGYTIHAEKIAVERNHAYVILSCQYTGIRRILKDLEVLVGPCLLMEPLNPGLNLYLDKLLLRLRKQSRGEPALRPVIELIQNLRARLPACDPAKEESNPMDALKDTPTTVGQILQVLNELAPPELAAEWDKIGLQIGDPDLEVRHALLALDVHAAVFQEALAGDCQLIICHHPLIFSPLDTIRADIPEQNVMMGLINSKISLIAAHTNLDAAPGGVADCLADKLGLSPAGRLVIAGYGRFNRLTEPEMLSQLLPRVRRELGSCGCRINMVQDRLVDCLAVFPGSFDEAWIPDLLAAGIDTLVCGEIKHHQALMLAARGITAIDAGHDVSERVVLAPLAAKLGARLPQISFAVSDGMDYNKMAF